MKVLVTLVGVVSILGFPYLIFMPMFARDILHVGETGLGLLMAASGVGAFLAATTLAWQGQTKHGGRRVALSAGLFYATVIAFCFSTNFLLSTLLQMVAGFSMILMVATTNTLLQHLAVDEMRGRVMSIYATAFLGFAPIGSLIAGALADTVPAQYAIAGMCALGLVCTAFMYGTRRELRGSS
jgi:MFS family permease